MEAALQRSWKAFKTITRDVIEIFRNTTPAVDHVFAG